MLPGQDRAYRQFLVHEQIVPMWLANITSSRIADPTARQNIELAQVEFSDALYEYVSKRSIIRREPSKLELARDLVAALEAKEALQATNMILAPKAGKWDRFMNADGLIGMTAIADMLDVPVKDLTKWLVEVGVFHKQRSKFGSNQNMPRRMYQSSGFFTVKVETNGKVAYARLDGGEFIIDEWDKRAAA
ncbi:phage antirepressor KilAC domain-containing protein [Streptomyces sp. NPDC050433]|uniref:phage antirepressor KilAC domain-containing protein n=1 Tax=Streptomyces sp. NPDC050433 TaxID=3365615 RepID=UPI003787FF49